MPPPCLLSVGAEREAKEPDGSSFASSLPELLPSQAVWMISPVSVIASRQFATASRCGESSFAILSDESDDVLDSRSTMEDGPRGWCP